VHAVEEKGRRGCEQKENGTEETGTWTRRGALCVFACLCLAALRKVISLLSCGLGMLVHDGCYTCHARTRVHTHTHACVCAHKRMGTLRKVTSSPWVMLSDSVVSASRYSQSMKRFRPCHHRPSLPTTHPHTPPPHHPWKAPYPLQQNPLQGAHESSHPAALGILP